MTNHLPSVLDTVGSVLGIVIRPGSFLADRTNGRAYATVLCLSVHTICAFVVCDVMYCG